MLQQHQCGLILVDIQGKLASMVMDNGYIEQTRKLIQACRVLSIPLIWLEQNPKGLGHTIPEITDLLDGHKPYEKATFSGLGSTEVQQAIHDCDRNQWLVCGIEAHICVYQTVVGLLEAGHQVEVVGDCISARTQANIDLALAKMQQLGARQTCFEMAIYELLGSSDKPEFKQILPLVKAS